MQRFGLRAIGRKGDDAMRWIVLFVTATFNTQLGLMPSPESGE